MPLYNNNTASTPLLTQINILIIKQLDLTELERIQVQIYKFLYSAQMLICFSKFCNLSGNIFSKLLNNYTMRINCFTHKHAHEAWAKVNNVFKFLLLQILNQGAYRKQIWEFICPV